MGSPQSRVLEGSHQFTDVLDQFNHDESPAGLVSPPPPPPTATTTTTFTRPRNNTRTDAPPISVPGSGANLDPMSEADEDQVSSEFAKELAKEMHTLVMQQLARGPDPVEGADSAERVRQFNEAWEAMLVEGLDGSTSSTGGAPPPNPFQNRLNQVVDKLRESEATLEVRAHTVPSLNRSSHFIDGIFNKDRHTATRWSTRIPRIPPVFLTRSRPRRRRRIYRYFGKHDGPVDEQGSPI